jgi:hypothetical protein
MEGRRGVLMEMSGPPWTTYIRVVMEDEWKDPNRISSKKPSSLA